MKFTMTHVRNIVPRLSLPMLGLAASYGVYRFALMFVPNWVAITQAGSFELVYLGLSIVQGFDAEQRRRSRYVGLGAVFVSVIYNALDSLFHRRPDMLVNTPLIGDIALAILHGAPLALVAYFVADLLLHSKAQHTDKPQTVKPLARRPVSMQRPMVSAKQVSYPTPQHVAIPTPDKTLTKNYTDTDDARAAEVRRLRDELGMSFDEIALQIGVKTRQSVSNLYHHGKTYAPRKTTPTITQEQFNNGANKVLMALGLLPTDEEVSND